MSPTEKLISFDSTTSSFLQNVNSFCQENSVMNVIEVKTDVKGVEFDSASSWFQENIEDYVNKENGRAPGRTPL